MEKTYYIQTSDPTMILVQTAPPPPLKKKSHKQLLAATGWIGGRIGITSFCLLSQVNICSEIYLLGTLFSSPRVQALHSLKDFYIWVTVGHFYRMVHKLECKLHATLLNRWFIHAQPHHWWIQRESRGGGEAAPPLLPSRHDVSTLLAYDLAMVYTTLSRKIWALRNFTAHWARQC